MKNLNIILNETSIINFPFVWSLIKRYKWIVIVVPILTFSGATIKHQSQHDFYSTTLGFKYVAQDAGSSAAAGVASILGDSTTEMSGTEIVAIVKALDFRLKLAEKIYEHPKFKSMNFNSYLTKKPLSWMEMFKQCTQKSCFISGIASQVNGLYQVQESGLIPNRFFLKIITLDSETTKILRELIPDIVEEDRIASIKRNLEKQSILTENLQKEKNNELLENDFYLKRDRHKELLVELTDLNQKLTQYESVLLATKSKFSKVKSMVKETQKSLSRGISSEEVGKSQRAKVLRENIRNLRDDLGSLMSAAGSISEKDQAIIRGIKKEIRDKEIELGKMDLKKVGLSGAGKFFEKREEGASYDEFEYKVLKEQYDKQLKEVEALKLSKEKLLEEKSALSNNLEKFEPSFKYLKLIETKLIQLRLQSSTVVTDLVFDRNDSGVLRSKLISKTKLSLAAFFGSFILVFLIIFLRYMIDDRIYNVDELEKNFADLEIIGNTPDFD